MPSSFRVEVWEEVSYNGRILDTERRVLIVDDEPEIGKIYSLNLGLAGYDAMSTTSGVDAIELVRTQKFDIMLLDVMMPDVTGLEVLYKVRAFSQIPIILFTPRADIFEVAQGAGANDYIAKPFDSSQLVDKIKAVLAGTTGKS